MPDALIHLRVPASLKARWVRESRAAGMRLTDWIIKKVEADVLSDVIQKWYAAHRQNGGEADPVIEDLFGEVLAEDRMGGGFSFGGGNA